MIRYTSNVTISMLTFLFHKYYLLQLNEFRSLSNGEDRLADNYRRLQDIGLRKVYVRRLNSSDETVFNITDLNWFIY